MVTVQEFWRPIINDLNPVGQVRPEDVVRFFVDRKEENRLLSIVEVWKTELQNSIGQPRPYKALLSGHVGSGKSSELMRLGQELVDRFFVVWLDAELTLSTETVNHFDILLAMGLAIHAAAQAAGLNPQARLLTQLANSLARLVRKFEEQEEFSLRKDQLLRQVFSFALVAGAVAVGGPAVALPAGALALGANKILKTARLELNVRDEHVKTLELPPNRSGVLGALNNIIEDVQEKAKKPLLVIIDGLDKVPFTRARLLFVNSALLAEPACALLYSAPIEFAHRQEGGQVLNFFRFSVI